jgi:hypothetical protein
MKNRRFPVEKTSRKSAEKGDIISDLPPKWMVSDLRNPGSQAPKGTPHRQFLQFFGAFFYCKIGSFPFLTEI